MVLLKRSHRKRNHPEFSLSFYFSCGLRKVPDPPLLLSSWKMGIIILTITGVALTLLTSSHEIRIWPCFRKMSSSK